MIKTGRRHRCLVVTVVVALANENVGTANEFVRGSAAALNLVAPYTIFNELEIFNKITVTN